MHSPLRGMGTEVENHRAPCEPLFQVSLSLSLSFSHTHMYMYTHACMHTHTHTHTHTCTQARYIHIVTAKIYLVLSGLSWEWSGQLTTSGLVELVNLLVEFVTDKVSIIWMPLVKFIPVCKPAISLSWRFNCPGTSLLPLPQITLCLVLCAPAPTNLII